MMITDQAQVIEPAKTQMSQTEWLNKRRSLVTATDIPKLAGISEWGSPLDVYNSKTGKGSNFTGSPAAEWGNRLEATIAVKWAENHNKRLRAGELLIKPGTRYGATPDFFIIGTKEILQIKTASPWKKSGWGRQGSSDIPKEYIAQVQWEMFVSGADVCHVAVLIGGSDYREYKVFRDENLLKEYQRLADNFLQALDEGRPPSPTKPSDTYGMSAHMNDALEGKDASEPEVLEVTDPDHLRILEEYAVAITNFRAAKAKKETIEAQVKVIMLGFHKVKSPSVNLTWVEKRDTSIDYARLFQDHKIQPDEVERYKTATSSGYIRCYINEGQKN